MALLASTRIVYQPTGWQPVESVTESISGTSAGVSEDSAAASVLVSVAGTSAGTSEDAGVVSTGAEVEPLFSDDFSSGDLEHTENGFTWAVDTSPGEGSIAVLPYPYGSGYGMRFRFDGGSAEHRFSLGANYTEVWFEYTLRIPDNFAIRQTAVPNKFFAIWANTYSVSTDFIVVTEFWGDNSTTCRARTLVRDSSFPMGTMEGFHNSSFITTSMAGQEFRVRIHVRVDSEEGANDGVAEGWLDDTLMWQSADQEHWTSDGEARNYLRNGYLMGSSNMGYDEVTDFWVRDFKVWVQSPGWGT